MINRNQKARGVSKRYGLYQAALNGDLRKYKRIEARWFKHWSIERTGKVSPMAQFDESHKRFLTQERDV